MNTAKSCIVLLFPVSEDSRYMYVSGGLIKQVYFPRMLTEN